MSYKQLIKSNEEELAEILGYSYSTKELLQEANDREMEKEIIDILAGFTPATEGSTWGGGEGERYNYKVWKYGEDYICAIGWYESHEGTTYDTIRFVNKREKVVTEWFDVESNSAEFTE
jgi:hypothetical protein